MFCVWVLRDLEVIVFVLVSFLFFFFLVVEFWGRGLVFWGLLWLGFGWYGGFVWGGKECFCLLVVILFFFSFLVVFSFWFGSSIGLLLWLCGF